MFQVDLPDCEVIAGTPPRIDSGHLSIGKSSQFVSDLPESHIKELVRGWLSSEGRGSLGRADRMRRLAAFRRFPAAPAQGCSVHRRLGTPLHAEFGEQA